MKKLLKYLKMYRLECVLGPLFKLLEASLELVVPLIVARIIDRGIGESNSSYALKMCLWLVLAGLVGLLFSVSAQYFAAKASVGAVARLKSALFSHIQTLSHAEIDSLGTSTLITRMTSDANQVQSGVNLTLRLLLRSPFVVFGAMIMAFTVDTRSALIFAVAIPVLSIVVFGIMLICLPLYKKVQQKLDTVLLKTRENLTGARVIRAFCKENEENEDFRSKNGELAGFQKKVGRISALLGPLTYVIINLAVIVLLRTGAQGVDSGRLSTGEVVALYNYMAQILVELIKLANLIINITKSVASANRIGSVFEIKPSVNENCGEVPEEKTDSPAVEFRNVNFTYSENAENALSDICFSAERGEKIGIIGGTGSGKSTLVNLIGRLYDAQEGEVLINGVPARNYPPSLIRKKIGYVPQKAVLFKGTVRDNLRWGNENASDDEMYRALDTAQARAVVEDKGGLDFMLEQGGRNLSGGQKQRLTIARALIRKPEILILDDSASALDFATDAALRKALEKNADNATVFIVSQRAASIMYLNRIIVLDNGRIAGIGRHDELLSKCLIYREIYVSQFGREDEKNV